MCKNYDQKVYYRKYISTNLIQRNLAAISHHYKDVLTKWQYLLLTTYLE